MTAAKGVRQTSPDAVGSALWLGADALLDGLDAVAGEGGVALLAAEPGSGKTALLRRWLAARASEAPQTTVARAGDPGALAQALRHLRFGAGGVVVIDDAADLDDDARVTLGEHVAGRRPGTAVVLASRAELGLCTVQLREAGLPVLEIDGADLAWEADEVATALAGWGWADVTPAEAADVAARTDGWRVAVRLVAAAGRGAAWDQRVLGAVRVQTGGDALDDLLALSLADELDGDTVGALLGCDAATGAARLDELRRRRLFLRPCAAPGRWRFCAPVLAALRRELAARPPSSWAAARRHAAAHALTTASALTGAAAAIDLGAALLEDDLLAGQALDLLVAGRLAAPAPTALGVAATASPLGRAAASLALLDAGDAELAATALPGAGAAEGHDELRFVHAVAAARRDADLAGTAASAARLARHAGASVAALGWAQLGLLELDLGWYAASEEHLRLAASMADAADAPAVVQQARAGRAGLAAMRCRLREAERLARAVPEDAPHAETRVRRDVALAHVAFLRDELGLAEEQLAAARASAAATRDPYVWFALLFMDMVVLDARGEDDRAFERLAEVVVARHGCPRPPAHAAAVDLYRMRLLDRAGRAAEVEAEFALLPAGRDAIADLVLARRALERGDPETATRLVRTRTAAEQDRPPTGLRAWHLTAYALAADRIGDADVAHAALEEALALAAPEGLVRPFIEDSVRLADLLARHRAAATAHTAFVDELLAHLAGARPSPDARLLHPLTDRELVVLGYLPTPLTAGEIAAELYVAEATVRTHMRHIYDKLGVSGRREAAERARELGVRARISR